MSNQKILPELERVLADTYCLYLKTQNYHWNVEGPAFKGLHDLFEEQYDNLATAIDDIAEHIRALDVRVDGRFSVFQKRSNIKDANHEFSAQEMLADLVESHEEIISSFDKAIDIAVETEDNVLEDYFIERKDFHRQARWMIKSSM